MSVLEVWTSRLPIDMTLGVFIEKKKTNFSILVIPLYIILHVSFDQVV
jgi:hypothetical protein